MTRYAAFLRGINVAGNNLNSMEDLRNEFASWDFANVKTLLASGSVIFDTTVATPQDIEQKMAKQFGVDSSVILHTTDNLREMAGSDLFRGTKITLQTRLYVMFLAEGPKSDRVPGQDENFRVLYVSGGEMLSVLTVMPGRKTVDFVKVLEDTFGKKVTTLNWNTVLRVVKAV